MATITRVFEFDAAHRVMNEKVKCFNLHGHRFKVEVTFDYNMDNDKCTLGYAIDFKEIKRILGSWIDEKLDHSCILNPQDKDLIDLCKKKGWKLYVMGLGSFNDAFDSDKYDLNPSAENLASELFYVIRILFNSTWWITLKNVRLYETPNCWVDADSFNYSASYSVCQSIIDWRKKKGEFNYDKRKD